MIYIVIVISMFLIPITMILLGSVFYFNPPKINDYAGYRTTLSKKNDDTWYFAQKHFGRTWFIVGPIILFLSVVLAIILYNKNDNFITWFGFAFIMIETLMLLLTILPTELALRYKFDKDGKRLM